MNSTPQRCLRSPIPATLLFTLAFGALTAGATEYSEGKKIPLVDFKAPWDDEMIARFARLPVQDNGRIKPLDTVARYSLLRFHGLQSIKFTNDPDVEPTKRSATEWVLYAIFAPDSIKDIPLFIIDDSEAAVIAGLEPGAKRDRYSYNEIIVHLHTLRDKALQFSKIPDKDRDRLQKMVIELYQNMNEFEYVTRFFEFAREGIPVPFSAEEGAEVPDGLRPDSRGRISVSGFLKAIPSITETGPEADVTPLERYASILYQVFTMPSDPDEAAKTRLRESVAALTRDSQMAEKEISDLVNRSASALGMYIGRTRAELNNSTDEIRKAREVADRAAAEGRWKAVQEALRITGGSASLFDTFPPPAASVGTEENDWFNPTDLAHLGIFFNEIRPFAVERLQLLESLNAAVGDKDAFKAAADRVFSLIDSDGAAQISHATIDREVRFYQSDFFTNSLVLFVLAFILVIVSFLAPRTKWGRILGGPIAVTCTVVALVLLTWGIVVRCLIMGRPPVGTLYETNLFIGAVAVFVGLAIEYFNRRRIALLLAAFIGAGLLFVANSFHLFESKDTMDPLVAVLRTNFWLSVHVTTVCMGYSAGLVAALIGNIYLLARLFGEPEQGDFSKELTRMAYGVVCFGMLFSLFGTVTGGIWANYSWGRFWGWDPKENGAFMIVLWNMVILHSRLGGYARQLGIHVLSIIGGMIVAFSWWGVNQLEVGLHSYGFTDGIMFWLLIFWGSQLLMVGLAIFIHFMRDYLASRRPPRNPLKEVSA